MGGRSAVVTALGEPAWAALVNQAFNLEAKVLDGLSPFLILAPHPDDETLGCGGLIARASKLGLKPRVVYLTDGEGSHKGSATWPPRRLARARRQEALAALDILGVPPDDVHFVGWPDGAPLPRDQAAYADTLRDLREWSDRFKPWSVWAPWRHEQHCDHVAANLLASDYIASIDTREPVKMEYLVWGWADPDLAHRHGAKGVWGLMCGDEIARRRRALACHETQMTPLIQDAAESFRVSPQLAALTDRPVEIFLECRR